jgi:hypothetical protein
MASDRPPRLFRFRLSVFRFSFRMFPPFEPHPLLRGGHAQTLAAVYLPSARIPRLARRYEVQLDDGDRLVLHDDAPRQWQAGDRVVALAHGLAGSHASGYMRRIAWKLNQRGLRTFRIDLRGWGAGFALARWPFHGGRSADVGAAIDSIVRLCPGSPITLIGFSLGASTAIKLLGEREQHVSVVDSLVAVCPPLDLGRCARRISEPRNRLYDRHFVAMLMRQIQRRRKQQLTATSVYPSRRPRTLYEFDDLFTAPACGFGTAENYYRHASAGQFLAQLEVDSLDLRAADDPLIDAEDFDPRQLPRCVEWEVTPSGGHVGFIARRGLCPDLRWMDWRVVDWVMRRAG